MNVSLTKIIAMHRHPAVIRKAHFSVPAIRVTLEMVNRVKV